VSLNSYKTDGPTWPTSGNQVFVDHDQITIDKNTTSGTLVVDQPTCFYQTDLYWGSTRYDGVDGALPHYPDSPTPHNLIDARNGGSGCQPPEEPKGSFTTECTATGAQADIGTLTEGGFTGGSFRLVWSGGSVAVTSGQQDVTVPASTSVTLEYVPAQGAAKELDKEQSPAACPPVETKPAGSFTQKCTDTGAEVTIGTLTSGTLSNVVWTLTYGSQTKTVVSGDTVAVPGDVQLALSWATGNKTDTVQTEKSVKACPPVVPPSGSFTTECTATGAQADVGTLSEGTFTGGSFKLVWATGSATVTTGQQDVTVPAETEIRLVHQSQAGEKELDKETSPKACPPPPPPTGDVTKTSVPVTGSNVAPGSTIDYTVTVKNTGQVAITNAPVVDTLPSHVTAVAGTVSDGGQVSADGRTITWTVSLAAGASKAFTYQGLVAANAPAGTSLVNKATFLLKESTTTHTVGSRGLAVVKSVSPTGAVEFGDTLTYSLTVTATGNLPQTNVVVSDPVPAGTTYTGGSATCDSAGVCTPSFADGVVTWGLGTMAAGSSRTVSFQVTVDTPEPDADGAIPAVTILNSGAAASTEVPNTPSNEVETPVVATKPVKEGPRETPEEVPAGPTDTGVLPQTGSGISTGMVAGIAGLLLLMGVAMVAVARPVRRR
jgi:uncharacterized repeat protein (TIGR01451 family)